MNLAGFRDAFHSSTRQSRACGNPGSFTAELAWIPGFAGMTEQDASPLRETSAPKSFSKEIKRESFSNEQKDIRPVAVAPISGLKPFGKLVKHAVSLVARNKLDAAL